MHDPMFFAMILTFLALLLLFLCHLFYLRRFRGHGQSGLRLTLFGLLWGSTVLTILLFPPAFAYLSTPFYTLFSLFGLV